MMANIPGGLKPVSLTRDAARHPWLVVTVGVHVVALIVLFVRPAAWPLVAAALAGNHGLLAIASVSPRSRLIGPNLRRLPRGASADQVALTFDDGPDPDVTPRLLRILAQYRARATFFCIAERAKKYPDVMRSIVDGGHRVENHSLKHAAHFALLGRKAMARDIAMAQNILFALTNQTPTYFRPPAGMRNPGLDLVLRRLNLSLVSWTRRGFDTVTRDPERVLRRLTRDLRAGDILVLHDGSCVRGVDGEPLVLKVLPGLLAHLAHENLAPVAIPPPRG